MTITIANKIANNQSILNNIALVTEIDEQAAEILSGGQFSNNELFALEDEDKEGVEPEENVAKQSFGMQRRWNDRNRNRNRNRCD
jgi:predicted HNH restriction endonuclease